MFIERKIYRRSGIGYEISDDYGRLVQLTPGEMEDLAHWLVNNAIQIHKDVQGEVMDNDPFTIFPFEPLDNPEQ